MQVIHVIAISIVIDAFAQFAQYLQVGLVQVKRGSGKSRGIKQVVTERRYYRPCPMPALQITVYQQTGTDFRPGLDMCLQARVLRDFAGKMMIEINK